MKPIDIAISFSGGNGKQTSFMHSMPPSGTGVPFGAVPLERPLGSSIVAVMPVSVMPAAPSLPSAGAEPSAGVVGVVGVVGSAPSAGVDPAVIALESAGVAAPAAGVVVMAGALASAAPLAAAGGPSGLGCAPSAGGVVGAAVITGVVAPVEVLLIEREGTGRKGTSCVTELPIT
jgi:hypothetical protein